MFSSVAIFLAVVALTVTATPASAESARIELRFDRLNGVYENLEADVEPIESGPVTVRLSSPEHRMELFGNELHLSRLDDNRHAVRGVVRFAGSGTLNADLDFSGVPASLVDRVTFPEQELMVEGTIAIERRDEGYLVTVEELPRILTIRMTSGLGSQLVAWCRGLALFVAGDAGCDDLDRELSNPKLPLPAPGASHLFRLEELTPEERGQIDLYLAEF